MPLTTEEADAYINLHVIDIDDWVDSETTKKQRVLNVASRILVYKFKDLVIPNNAVYEFASVLATATNDTNRMQMQGIESFSITDVGSFKFNRAISDYSDLIPQSALDLIGIENDVEMPSDFARIPLWTVVG